MTEAIGKTSPDSLHTLPLGTSQSAMARTTTQPNFNSNSCSYAGGKEIDDASHSSDADLARRETAATSGYESNSPVRVKTGSEPPSDQAVGGGVHVLPLVQTPTPKEEVRNSIRVPSASIPASNEQSTKKASIPDTRTSGPSGAAAAAHEHGKHPAQVDDSSSTTSIQQQQQQKQQPSSAMSSTNQNSVHDLMRVFAAIS